MHGTTDTVDIAHDGVASTHVLCTGCRARLYNTTAAAPGMVVLRAGPLDDAAARAPVAHIWTRRRQRWVAIPEGIPTWSESPTPAAFAEALASVR